MKTYAALICLSLVVSTGALADPVAEIAETKGAVTVQRADGRWRLISSRSNLEPGDTVVTQANSSAVLAFTDGGKVALRPETRFQIVEYQHVKAAPERDNALLKLITGGLRTLTGLIGKRGNADAYRMQSSTATIGIRGTEFTARVCHSDCGSAPLPSAAHVTALQGAATATDTSGRARELSLNGPIHAGDIVQTAPGAYVGLVFADESRMVLRGDSRLQVREYSYDAARPQEDKAVLKLLRGAFRAITGLLGKRNAGQVRYETTTATIGIRGTQWDAWCVPKDSYSSGGGGATLTRDCDEGLLVRVSDGRVAVDNPAGSTEVAAGQTAYANGAGAAPTAVAPAAVLPPADGAPDPGALPPPAPTAPESADGLVVIVHEGRVAVTAGPTTLDLGRGETAFAPSASTPPLRMSTPPAEMRTDPFLKSVDFDAVSCTL
ncbi:MAG: FecR domain-containing protein [Rhodocyclaceae bacterium]|nr:FecR domain-containing protein [Rhodocyclaceae bacterium]MBX3669805.1 FecR domain-containing protein [Rhodocyclaceae bacterium]